MRHFSLLDSARFVRASKSIVLDGSEQQLKLKTYFDPVLTYLAIYRPLQVASVFLLFLLWNETDVYSKIGYVGSIVIGQIIGALWANQSLREVESANPNIDKMYLRLFVFCIGYSLTVNLAVFMWIRSAPDNVLLIHFASWAIAIIVLHGSFYFNSVIAVTATAMNLTLFMVAAYFTGNAYPEYSDVLSPTNMMLPFTVTSIAAYLSRKVTTSHYRLSLDNQISLHKEQMNVRQSLDNLSHLNLQMSAIANSSEHGIALINNNEELELKNPRFCEIFDVPADWKNPQIRDWIPDEIIENSDSQFEFQFDDGRIFLISKVFVETNSLAKSQVLFLTDITRKTYEDSERARLERLGVIGVLSSGIAHDFNNLLAIMQNQVDIISVQVPDLDEGAPITDIRHAISSASSLARQLLSYTHNLNLTGEVTIPSDVVREAIEISKTSLGREIVVELAAISEDTICLDRNIFKVNLLNILLNARDAIRGSGTIKIEISKNDGYVDIAVKDNGQGMDKVTLEQALDPFYSTKDRATNTGLGLALAKSFIEKSGGKIALTSQAGIGTNVMISFPIYCDEPNEENHRNNKGIKHLDKTKRDAHIAIIDDNEALLRSQAALLQIWFEKVSRYSGLAELQAAASIDRYDAILCDLFLDSETGVDILRFVRQQGSTTPIIFFSGNVPPHLRNEIHTIEDAPILEKPVDINRLVAEIDAAIGH